MNNDNKDKIIMVLIIGIVLILSYNFVNRKNDNEFIANKDINSLSTISNSNDYFSKTDDKVKFNDADNDKYIIKVHISGEISNPGVYIVNKNDRLDDLVKKAGGLLENADIDRINLALRLEDQMRIIIPNINDIKDEEQNFQTFENIENKKNDSRKININTADQNTLMTLPNIGEKRALAIIEYRKDNKFNKIEDIKSVSGIGDKYFEAMKDMIVVD